MGRWAMADGTPQMGHGRRPTTHNTNDQLRTWAISAKRQSGFVLALSWEVFCESPFATQRYLFGSFRVSNEQLSVNSGTLKQRSSPWICGYLEICMYIYIYIYIPTYEHVHIHTSISRASRSAEVSNYKKCAAIGSQKQILPIGAATKLTQLRNSVL